MMRPKAGKKPESGLERWYHYDEAREKNIRAEILLFAILNKDKLSL